MRYTSRRRKAETSHCERGRQDRGAGEACRTRLHGGPGALLPRCRGRAGARDVGRYRGRARIPAHGVPDDDGPRGAGVGAIRSQRDLHSRPGPRHRSGLQLRPVRPPAGELRAPLHPGADVVLDGRVPRGAIPGAVCQ
jgi:hypothetical protein